MLVHGVSAISGSTNDPWFAGATWLTRLAYMTVRDVFNNIIGDALPCEHSCDIFKGFLPTQMS